MKGIGLLVLLSLLVAVVVGGSGLLAANYSQGCGNIIATTPEAPQVVPEIPVPRQQPAQPRTPTVDLPAGVIVEHDETGLVLLAPDGRTIAALYQDDETGTVGYLCMSGVTGRYSSGIYQAVQFPDQFNVLVVETPNSVQLIVNLPLELMQDFVQTFIEFSLEANGVIQTAIV